MEGRHLFMVLSSQTRSVCVTDIIIGAAWSGLVMGPVTPLSNLACVRQAEAMAQKCWPELPLVWLNAEPLLATGEQLLETLEQGNIDFDTHDWSSVEDQCAPPFFALALLDSWHFSQQAASPHTSVVVGWFKQDKLMPDELPITPEQLSGILEQSVPTPW